MQSSYAKGEDRRGGEMAEGRQRDERWEGGVGVCEEEEEDREAEEGDGRKK